MTIDLFTPWQEDGEAVDARTVGQEDVLAALDLTTERFSSGEKGMPMWIAGPRGIGKSHLVTVARRRATARGLATSFVSEDASPCSSGEMLFERLLLGERYAGRRWSKVTLPTGPLMVFAEGMDRQLHAVKERGARTLRRLLDAHPVMLVATGVDVPPEVTKPDAPFYGQFDVWRLGALSEVEAEQLVRKVLDEQGLTATGETRVRAILRLCGGQPRALLALAEACRGPDAPGIADALGQVVSRMVPHYQMRLRDLSPEGQHVVEALAMAPRGLQPSELELSNPSKVLGRLRDEAVVRKVPFGTDGRETWYTLEEPLLRHFVEFRSTTVWEDTRAAMAARLIGEVLTRDEVVNVWWARPDPALLEIPEVREALSARFVQEFTGAVQRETRKEIFARAMKEQLSDALPQMLSWGIILGDPVWEWIDSSARGVDPERALVSFVREASSGLRYAFDRLIKTLSVCLDGSTRRWFWISRGVQNVLHMSEPRGAPWTRRVPHLEKIWFLRGPFLIDGRRPGERPILQEEDLPLSSSDPDLPALVGVAHQKRSRTLWRRVLGVNSKLPSCLRPELQAVEVDGFLAAAQRSNPALVLTWAATFPLLSEAAYDELLEGLKDAKIPQYHLRDDFVTALGALGLRVPERWHALAELPPFVTKEGLAVRVRVDMLLGQLAERERGPLHPELAYIAERLGHDASRNRALTPLRPPDRALR